MLLKDAIYTQTALAYLECNVLLWETFIMTASGFVKKKKKKKKGVLHLVWNPRPGLTEIMAWKNNRGCEGGEWPEKQQLLQ